MFSANENLMLRQHKRRIVDRVEKSMPEEALDMGTTVMVMQVSCKAPGCVPLETAIIIIFPKATTELVPGLPESNNGGSYKTKILKPMADVTEDDILDALPPAFQGGTRTMEKLCIYARDVMIAQITQLFGEDDDETAKDREAMAGYLQSCLQQYVAAGCKPPELGRPFSLDVGEGTQESTVPSHADKEGETYAADAELLTDVGLPSRSPIPAKGNIVLRRVIDESESSSTAQTASFVSSSSVTTTSIRGQPPPRHQKAIAQALNSRRSNTISRLFDREHAPGIRQSGCPCCDPDNPSTIAESMMML